MAAIKPIRKIIWALDAFEDSGVLRERMSEVVRNLVQKTSATVEAVYVLGPGQMDLSLEFGQQWISQYRPAAERALEHFLAQVNLRNLVTPKVMVEDFTTTSQIVGALTSHAQSIGADLIITGTHGRSGMKRMLLGSFAETLLQKSEVPVLTVGGNVHERVGFGKILFPTDFGEHSKATFRAVTELARCLGSEITLFHAIPHPVEPVLQSGAYLLGGGWVPVEAYIQGENDRKDRHAQAWARWARTQGIHVDVRIEDSRFMPVPDLILKLAREGAYGLVAMEAQSGPVAAALIGSITRGVLRHADCPVWVLRSDVAASQESALKQQRVRRAA